MSEKQQRPVTAHSASEVDAHDESQDVVHTASEFDAIQNGRERSDTVLSRPRRLSAVRRQSSRRGSESQGIVGRVRGISISKILDANPAPGMWAALVTSTTSNLYIC